MAFIKRAFALGVVALAVVPFAVAHNQPQPPKSDKECQNQNGHGWFYHQTKDCCLPPSPPKQPPSPPSGKSCPPSGWYWGDDKGCCLPTTPQPPHNPPPQCKSGHGWQPSLQCCTPHAPTPPSNPPKPSNYPGHGSGGYNNGHGGYNNGNGGHNNGNGGHNNGHGSYHKRSQLSRSASGCGSKISCPLPKQPLDANWECVDVNDITSCGGCVSTGKGQDCSKIEGVAISGYGCASGKCYVDVCQDGYLVSYDHASCVKV